MFKERLNFFLGFFNKSFFIKREDLYIYIKQRNFNITKKFVGFKFLIHNGKFFIPITFNDNMCNKMLGSFVFSRTIRLKKKIKEKIKKR